ncbi:MAG TPA: malic enzyme-like NAD(P)-binding protein, partial [Xanthobacteraceae bacterium]|nr:malic enzyme-like NAD(P)-binding protein [Xanthobacteraceae bacterium]
VEARCISDGMFLAAARTIADLSPAKRDAAANLLAPLVDLREVSFHVAIAVAKQAQAEGLAEPLSDELIAAAARDKMWEPVYAPYRRLPAPT